MEKKEGAPSSSGKKDCLTCEMRPELKKISRSIENRIIEGVFKQGKLVSYCEKRRVPEKDALLMTPQTGGAEKLNEVQFPFSDTESVRTFIRNYIIWGNYINEELRTVIEIENVERLTEEDWQQFNFLRLQGLYKEPQNFGKRFVDEIRRTEEELKTCLKECEIYGVFCEGELVAIAALENPGINNPAATHKRIITGVYVRPDKRRQGIADIITSRLISIAKKQAGIKQVNLTVTGNNQEAINLYEKYGFEVEGKQKDAVRIEGTNYDWYHMRLKLEDKETGEK